MPRLLPRTICSAVCAATLAPLAGLAAAPAAASGDPGPLRPICFPVEGAVSYTDTYGDPRSGGRTHEGQDLMGTKLQHLLAASDATVSALAWSPTGNYIFLTDADGWQYWYIHVNNDTPGTDDGANPFDWAFAPGMAVGATVRAGQFIGFLGDSGNAEDTGPHLHFELHQPDGSWGGLPVNPYTSLQNASTCPAVAPEVFAPFPGASEFATQQYLDFLGREPDAAGLDYWVTNLNSGALTPSEMIGQMMASAEFGQTISPVVRLYFAYFHRVPDTGGLTYWLTQYRSGVTLGAISDAFTQSHEFLDTYSGVDTDAEFVDLVYQNVLGRPPDTAGRDFWLDQMQNHGLTKGALMVAFSESPEYETATANQVYVTMAYYGMLRRTPDPAGYTFWLSQPIESLVDGIQRSAEYAARFSDPKAR